MDREQQLDEVITAYLKVIEAGEPVNPADWLKRYPDIADDLAEFFASQRSVERVAAPLREQHQPASTAEAPTLPPSFQVGSPPAPDTIAPNTEPIDDGDTPIQPGDTVRYFGDYELLAEIARGGMGVVYKARQVRLNRPVALKMILSGQLASATDVQRFYAEAQTAANLHHPNIVAIHEVGEHKGQHYFSMDLVEGKSLAALTREHPLTPVKAAEIVKSVAEAIHHAHQKGVLHRDLKPANVLIDSTGQPRVTDFGLAKRIDGGSNLTATGAVLGTPSYMPPEQASADHGAVGPATDVYSLGAVLYELVTGRPPFQGPTPMDILLQVLSDDPVPPRQLQPKLPANLETICLKCLHKEPNKRYATAAALAEDLGRFLADEPILARPAGRAERLAKWIKRRPAVAALLMAVGLVTMIGVAAFAWAFSETVVARDTALDEQKKTANALKDSDAARKKMERLLNINQIRQAYEFVERNDFVNGQLSLDDCPKEQRGPEYGFVQNQIWRKARPLFGHDHTIASVALSGDGQRLVTVDAKDAIRVWDLATGQQIPNLAGAVVVWKQWSEQSKFLVAADAGSCRVAISTDGKRLAAIQDTSIRLWNLETGDISNLVGHADSVRSLAFSPDGTHLFSGGHDLTIKLWDAKTGKEIDTLKGHTRPVLFLTIKGDGKRLVSGNDRETKQWDVAARKQTAFPTKVIGSSDRSLSSDGKRLAQAGIYGDISVLELDSGKNVRLPVSAIQILRLSLSADGRRLFVGNRDMVAMWDVEARKELAAVRAHKQMVTGFVHSDDGQVLISTGFDEKTVVKWDLDSTRESLILQNPSDVAKHTDAGIAVSSDGTRVVAPGAQHSVRIWDLNVDKEPLILGRHTIELSSVAISRDGKRIASTSLDSKVHVWGPGNDKKTLTLGEKPNYSRIALSPDGRWLASLGWSDSYNRIKIWDLTTGKVSVTLLGQGRSGAILSLAFSPDGNRLFAGWNAGIVTVWDVETETETRVLQGHFNSAFRSLSISGNGKRLAAGISGHSLGAGMVSGGTIHVWDLDSNETRVFRGHTEQVNSVALSNDGRRLFSASEDKTIKIWDVELGREILTLRGHTDAVTGVALSGDDKRLFSGSRDGTIKVWDMDAGR